ncbi:hypothetical protein [Erythrobacter sp. WG]|uniref:hypothetical protein n=1 Tax=Erythrobacter sp. WG TaxID=2985510 RepID=UPI0022701A98|nr:hypothetical protein [Erythrobacter sp. WG]MCX9146611.1 hypothetical protein [Erythrobacter sp. WG]
MRDLDELRRTFIRIEHLPDFQPDQRIWWIYVRNAAIEVVSRADLPELQAATDLVQDFPEKRPMERERWLAFREAVGLFLAQTSSE